MEAEDEIRNAGGFDRLQALNDLVLFCEINRFQQDWEIISNDGCFTGNAITKYHKWMV
jgi:hypothetical protein